MKKSNTQKVEDLFKKILAKRRLKDVRIDTDYVKVSDIQDLFKEFLREED